MTNTTNITKKITKREILNTIYDMCANGADIDESFYPVIAEYAQKELAALDKKNEARREAKSNSGIQELIIETLSATDKPTSVSELMSTNPQLVTAVNYSTAKVTAALTELRNAGKVKRDVIKRVSYYQLTA